MSHDPKDQEIVLKFLKDDWAKYVRQSAAAELALLERLAEVEQGIRFQVGRRASYTGMGVTALVRMALERGSTLADVKRATTDQTGELHELLKLIEPVDFPGSAA